MALVTDDFDGAALAAQWTFDSGTPTTATYEVAAGRIAVTLPNGNFDSISSAGGADNSAGVTATMTDDDFDVALQVSTDVSDSTLLGWGFYAANADETGAVRVSVYASTEQARLYAYHRAGGSGASVGPTPTSGFGYNTGHPAWCRLTRTGDDWAVYLSGNGYTWGGAVASFTRVFTLASLKLKVMDTAGGGVVALDRVVNLAADGTTDARAASPARARTQQLAAGFTSALPPWLEDDSASSGTAGVVSGALRLEQATDTNGSTGRVAHVGDSWAEAGLLAKFRVNSTSANVFLVAGVGYDAASPPLNQYARGPAVVLEIPSNSTTLRVVRVSDPGSWTNFETPFTFLAQPVWGEHAEGQWEWLRLDYGARRFRARWWVDGAAEPSVWGFDGADEILDGSQGLGVSLAYSHNDGGVTPGTATCDVDELTFYALTAAGHARSTRHAAPGAARYSGGG
jgi:hypothetical protein